MNSTRRAFMQRAAAAFAATATGIGTRSEAAESSPPAAFGGKFAICNELFGDWPFDRAFGLAAECGYVGVEIAPFTVSNDVTDISASKRREIRKQAERAGLEVAGLHWLLAKTTGFHLTSPDRDTRARTAEYLGELARFCADLGGKLLIFGSPKQRNLQEGVDRQQGMRYATEVFNAALPVLEATDVTLAWEPLSPRTTNFLQTAAEAVELVELIDSPRCRLILDCNAMAHEEKSAAELIRQHRSRLAHFHANDPSGLGPGFGKLQFVPIFRALLECEFRGWVSVEVFNYEPGPERLARESIEYMRKCLAQAAS